jgi:hypothetical protein
LAIKIIFNFKSCFTNNGPISESLFSFGHTQDNIIGKATFKIENDFNGQTKNPSTKEFYLEKGDILVIKRLEPHHKQILRVPTG